MLGAAPNRNTSTRSPTGCQSLPVAEATTLKVHLTPKYFFRLNKSWHLFEMHCAFFPLFSLNLDFLQAVKVTKSSHYLLHDRASKGYGSIPGAIIRDADRKSWDSRGPMIWDNFSIFRTNCAILTSWIHARVVGSRVDVVTLRDQLVRVARYSCRFFSAMAGNKAEKKNQGSSVYFNALM